MAIRSIYQRLSRKQRTLIGFSQLWLAPDHILLVRSTRFMERYQRFSLSDIQAIVVTELPDRAAFQFAVLAVVIAAAGGFFAVSSMVAKIPLAVVAAIGMGIILTNIALGPACRCYLHTAVSKELLPVVRVRAARRFLQRIRPAIEAVQGALTPERAATVTIPAATSEKPPDVVHSPSYLPEVLFALLLIDGALVMANLRFPKAELWSVLLSAMFGEIILMVVALLRRAGRDPRRIIYALMIPAIFCIGWDGFHIASTFVDWLNGVAQSARRGDPAPPSILTWHAFSSSGALFAAVWRIAAGAIGLAASWFERGSLQSP